MELKPGLAVAHHNLGAVSQERGELDDAIARFRRALELNPDYAEAHHSLGLALRSQGKLEQAAACFLEALRKKPDFADAHNNLGNIQTNQRKFAEAVASFHRALELRPDFFAAHNNLGIVLRETGNFTEAIASYRRALELTPNSPDVYNNLGIALKEQGEIDEAVACHRRALEIKPDCVAAHSNLLLALQYRPGVTPAGLAEAHAEYDRMYAAPLRTACRPQDNVRERTLFDEGPRPLRVGFVSPDFGRHPVGYLLVRALENLDRGRCETVCYSDRLMQDDLATRFHAAAATWRDVVGVSDEQLAEQIRADRIDVLFDLAGHTARNRLLVFARRPAPIQITWLGYEGTTGLEAMNYILADRHTIPAGKESSYREQVLRMPDGYVCYDPPAAAPEPGPLPAVENGFVRFGSFNNLAKINAGVVEVWAKILRRVPQSRLMLKYFGLGEGSVRDRYLGMFTALGVDAARIELSLPSGYAQYLAAFGEVDIALDPFPFGGGVTTCDGLWMGVPVVTCPGETFASRHGLSYLANVGLTETVAGDFDEYVEIAVGLAGDLPRLAAMRAGLRGRMAALPLCDGKRFAANFAEILREVWRESCEAARGLAACSKQSS